MIYLFLIYNNVYTYKSFIKNIQIFLEVLYKLLLLFNPITSPKNGIFFRGKDFSQLRSRQFQKKKKKKEKFSLDVTTARINRRHVLNFPRTTTKKAVENRVGIGDRIEQSILNIAYRKPATHPPRRMLTFPCKSVSKWLVLLAPLAVVVTLNPGKMATSSSMLVPLRLFDVASAMLNIVIVRRNVVLKRFFSDAVCPQTSLCFILDFILLANPYFLCM